MHFLDTLSERAKLVTGIAGAVVAVVAALAVLPTPATQEWTRGEINRAIQVSDGKVIALNLAVVETRLDVVRGQLSLAKGGLMELELRNRDFPSDRLVINRIREVRDEIEELEERERTLKCELFKLRGLFSIGC